MSDDFFIRRKVVGKEKESSGPIVIPEGSDFDLTNDDDIVACGLERDSFIQRNKDMFDEKKGMGVKPGQNPVAALTSRLEEYFSKREIAFLLSKSMLHDTGDALERIIKARQANGK